MIDFVREDVASVDRHEVDTDSVRIGVFLASTSNGSYGLVTGIGNVQRLAIVGEDDTIRMLDRVVDDRHLACRWLESVIRQLVLA